jgi:hypothetical protein
MSKIVLKHDNKEYELEYNRQSVKMMEGQGFVLEEFTSKPMTMIPLLFHGAFIKNCKGIKRAKIDEIYDGIGNKTDLIGALVEMYAETLSTLTDDIEEGNVSWELVK